MAEYKSKRAIHVRELEMASGQPRCRQPGSLRGKIWLARDFDKTPPEIVDVFFGEGPSAPDETVA